MSNLKQTVELKQTTTMTQELQESLKILQLSSIELSSYLRKEIENNPFLNDDKPSELGRTNTENSYSREATYKNSNKEFDIENYSTLQKTLKQHVYESINLSAFSPRERIIALRIADTLDSAGYVTINHEEVIEQIKCTKEEILGTLTILQTFEPPGIFARNLKECLAIQLKDKELLSPIMEGILNNLDLVASAQIDKLANTCKASKEAIIKNINIIKNLNPKPGAQFEYEEVSSIQPDAYLFKENNEWALELNSNILPSMIINNKYFTKLNEANIEIDTRRYIKSQYTSAKWLAAALQQRFDTLFKIFLLIAKKQKLFFEYGIDYLYPLKLIDIAEELGFSCSTISRAISNKYLSTPKGIFEIRYFLSTGVSDNAGEACQSNTKVKQIIQKIISQENNVNLLSDEQIVDKLKQENINISRRTVTKYRKQLNIPSSSQRKRRRVLESI